MPLQSDASGLLDGQDFLSAAFLTDQHHGQFTRLLTRAALSTCGGAKNQIPMCSLQPLPCSQVQVLPRQWMVGPSSDSRLRLGETPVGASSAVNGRACQRHQAAGGDWPAALANVQAATVRENCRPEIASSSEASEGGKFGTAEPR